MIDLVAANNKKMFRDIKAIPSVSVDSDHRLIVAKIDVGPQRKRAKRKKIKLEKLKDEETCPRMKDKINSELDQEIEGGLDEQWLTFKGTLKAAAEEILGVKYSGSSKKKTTPWWGSAMDAMKEKMTKFKRWMKTRNKKYK